MENQKWLLGVLTSPDRNFRIHMVIWTEKCWILEPKMEMLRDAFKKKKYVDRGTVPIPPDSPTIKTVSEYLDREYW